jgi:hypothetical protein
MENAGELRLNILRRRDKSRSKRSGQNMAPQPGDVAFMDWWHEICNQVHGVAQEGLKSLIILGV